MLTWHAYRNGVLREMVAFSAILLAIPIAGLFYDDLGAKLDPIIDQSILARLVAFLSLFASVVVIGHVGAQLLRRTAEILNLGWADAWAGGIFGFAKGVLIVQAVLIGLVAYPKPDIRATIDTSPVARGLVDAAPVALQLLPQAFESAVDQFGGEAVNTDDPDAPA